MKIAGLFNTFSTPSTQLPTASEPSPNTKIIPEKSFNYSKAIPFLVSGALIALYVYPKSLYEGVPQNNTPTALALTNTPLRDHYRVSNVAQYIQKLRLVEFATETNKAIIQMINSPWRQILSEQCLKFLPKDFTAREIEKIKATNASAPEIAVKLVKLYKHKLFYNNSMDPADPSHEKVAELHEETRMGLFFVNRTYANEFDELIPFIRLPGHFRILGNSFKYNQEWNEATERYQLFMAKEGFSNKKILEPNTDSLQDKAYNSN